MHKKSFFVMLLINISEYEKLIFQYFGKFLRDISIVFNFCDDIQNYSFFVISFKFIN